MEDNKNLKLNFGGKRDKISNSNLCYSVKEESNSTGFDKVMKSFINLVKLNTIFIEHFQTNSVEITTVL